MSPPLLFDCELPTPSPHPTAPAVTVAAHKRRRAGAASTVFVREEPAAKQHPLLVLPTPPARHPSNSSLTSATTACSSSSSSSTELDLEAPLHSAVHAVDAAAAAAVPTAPRRIAPALKLCFGASGVYVCYLAYGHIQEDVYRFESPLDGSKFTAVWFLQVLECACNVLVGMVGRKVCGGHPPSRAALRGFAQSGASQVLAKVLTSLSLAAGLSFPICVLAKSAKIVPVMLGQLVLGGSKYGSFDAFWAGAVVLGTTLLSLGGGSSSSQQQLSTPAGLLFIVLSLVMDGVTAGLQKRLKKDTEGRPPTTYDFLLFTNAAMLAVAFAVAIALGDLSKGSIFLSAHPVLLQMVVLSCLLSALGQSFVFYVVAHFDPAVCATVTTTRKILSVLWSLATKGHSVPPRGGIGLALAVGGILLGLAGEAAPQLRKHQQHKSRRPRIKAPRSPEPPHKPDDASL